MPRASTLNASVLYDESPLTDGMPYQEGTEDKEDEVVTSVQEPPAGQSQVLVDFASTATAVLARNAITDGWAAAVVDTDDRIVTLGLAPKIEMLESFFLTNPPSAITLVHLDPNGAVEEMKHLYRLISAINLQDQVLIDEIDGRKNKFLGSTLTTDAILESLKGVLHSEVETYRYKDLMEHYELRVALKVLMVGENLKDLSISSSKSFEIQTFVFDDFLLLDAAAIEGLQLVRSPGTTAGPTTGHQRKIQSLEDLFRVHLRSPMANKYLRQWILYPSRDINEIQHRQNLCTILVRSENLRRILAVKLLRKLGNLDTASMIFRTINASSQEVTPSQRQKDQNAKMKNKLSLRLLLSIYASVLEATTLHAMMNEIAQDLKAWIDVESEDECRCFISTLNELCRRLEMALNPLKRFIELIEHAIDIDQWKNNERLLYYNPVALLNPCVSEDLHQAAKAKDRAWKAIESYASKVALKMSDMTDNKKIRGTGVKIIKDERAGFVLRVPKSDHPRVLKVIGKDQLTLSRLNKNEFIFGTVDFDELKEVYLSLRSDVTTQGNVIIDMLGNVAASYHKPLDLLSKSLSFFDCVNAFASVAAESGYKWCRPTIQDDGHIIDLKGLRHALLCELDTTKSGKIIANDVFMDRSSERFILVTGPNMGGKSTLIRSCALAVVLAQIGAWVPCTSATLPILGKVLCRVGAGDAIFRGVSTFMAEMMEVSTICQLADEKSLILIDELGRGTSTADGFGLAYAIAEHLASSLKCFTFFATHFSEMQELLNCPKSSPHVQAVHFSIQEGNDGHDPSHEIENRLPNTEKSLLLDQDDIDTDDSNRPTSSDSHLKLPFSYKAFPGVCTKSYGLKVAAMARLPEDLIEDASQILSTLEDSCNQ